MDRIDIADPFVSPRSLIVQPTMSDLFEGRRVAFTPQKDNDLDWVVDRARFYTGCHLGCHGADAVLV